MSSRSMEKDSQTSSSEHDICQLELRLSECKDNNCYYKLDRKKFDELAQICLRHRHGHMSFLRHSKKHLLEWIDSVLPKEIFEDEFYGKHLTTKLYFIFYGLNSFPRCKHCGKEIVKKRCRNLFSCSTLDFCSHSCQTRFLWPKISSTKIKKDGDLWNYEKCKQTWKQRHGCENPMQTQHCQSSRGKKYFYNGKTFDSAPELAFYMYLLEEDIDFEYQPRISFEYEFEGVVHKYFPDFKVRDQIVELKGDHFFKDGKMICPFRKKEWTSRQYERICQKYEAKHQCMIANNVQIMTSKDYQRYLDYVELKHGKKYLKQFRKK